MTTAVQTKTQKKVTVDFRVHFIKLDDEGFIDEDIIIDSVAVKEPKETMQRFVQDVRSIYEPQGWTYRTWWIPETAEEF